MLIRTRGEQDVPGCVKVLRSVHEHDGYPAVWPSDPGRWVTSVGTDAAAWVAIDNHDTIRGHVAARAGVHDTQLTALTGYPAGRLLSVVRLFVDPAGRERGTGAALLRAVADYSRRSQLLPTLDVADTGAAARRLYDRLGWTCLGTRRADWRDAGGRYPVLYLYALQSARQGR
jgi:ribosomal-protein-alanine N-acetyltransferase